MFLICNKHNDVILSLSKEIIYLDNGYPKDDTSTSYPIDMVNIFEVDNISTEINVGEYCYTKEKGFYKNEKYIKPYILTEDMYKDILSNIDYLMLLNDSDSLSDND